MPCGEPLLRKGVFSSLEKTPPRYWEPQRERGRGPKLSKLVTPLFSFIFYLFSSGYEPYVVHKLRYLKLAYENLQPLSTHTWTSNTTYGFQKLGPRNKREAKLYSEKQLSTYFTVVEGGQTTLGDLILARYGQDKGTS